MILLIDNYDSFTYNLYHQIARFGIEAQVVRNDAITIEEIRKLNMPISFVILYRFVSLAPLLLSTN